MKLAYFHTNTILSSWNFWGAAHTLRRMSHEVLDAAIPTNEHGAVILTVTGEQFENFRAIFPSLDYLNQCDRIVVAGPEYVSPWLGSLYGADWQRLTARKIGLCLESSTRAEYLAIDQVGQDYDVCYYPDPRDVERIPNARLQRPHIDVERFSTVGIPKLCDVGFVGSLYPKRQRFVQSLQRRLGVQFCLGDVRVHSLEGEHQELWTSLYVRSINRLRIHVSLPSINPMTVTRPFETMACGVFLLESTELPEPLDDGTHYRRYDEHNPQELARLIEYYLAHEQEREQIARAGQRAVREHFSAERFWTDILKGVL